MITSHSTIDQNYLYSKCSPDYLTTNVVCLPLILADTSFNNSLHFSFNLFPNQKFATRLTRLFPYCCGNITYSLSTYITGSEQLTHSLQRIEDISKLQNNWDGFDAEPFSNNLIAEVISIVTSLKIQPQIFPTAQSSIQLEYENSNGDYLEFEIFEDGSIKQFSMLIDGTCNTIEKISRIDIIESIDKFYGQ